MRRSRSRDVQGVDAPRDGEEGKRKERNEETREAGVEAVRKEREGLDATEHEGSDNTGGHDQTVRTEEGQERVLRERELGQDQGSHEVSPEKHEEGARYANVSVDHPRIVEGIRALKQKGYSTEKIVKIVGMPHEIVRKHEREMEK